jgi:hypothetical protein
MPHPDLTLVAAMILHAHYVIVHEIRSMSRKLDAVCVGIGRSTEA